MKLAAIRLMRYVIRNSNFNPVNSENFSNDTFVQFLHAGISDRSGAPRYLIAYESMQ